MHQRRLKLVAAAVGLATAAGTWFAWSRPLVLDESFLGHAHCIKVASSSFTTYARDQDGRFPSHTNGCGDALLLMTNSNLLSS